MGESNVELVRRGYDHFMTEGTLFVEALSPDFVWDMSTFRGWPERKTYPGIAGTQEFMDDWLDAWDDWSMEIEDMREAPDGRVVATMRQHGVSKATGLPVDMRFGQVWTVRDGMQVRMEMYASPEEALEATGLGERG
jgi:ketosteroid isomerase-like protein